MLYSFDQLSRSKWVLQHKEPTKSGEEIKDLRTEPIWRDLPGDIKYSGDDIQKIHELCLSLLKGGTSLYAFSKINENRSSQIFFLDAYASYGFPKASVELKTGMITEAFCEKVRMFENLTRQSEDAQTDLLTRAICDKGIDQLDMLKKSLISLVGKVVIEDSLIVHELVSFLEENAVVNLGKAYHEICKESPSLQTAFLKREISSCMKSFFDPVSKHETQHHFLRNSQRLKQRLDDSILKEGPSFQAKDLMIIDYLFLGGQLRYITAYIEKIISSDSLDKRKEMLSGLPITVKEMYEKSKKFQMLHGELFSVDNELESRLKVLMYTFFYEFDVQPVLYKIDAIERLYLEVTRDSTEKVKIYSNMIQSNKYPEIDTIEFKIDLFFLMYSLEKNTLDLEEQVRKELSEIEHVKDLETQYNLEHGSKEGNRVILKYVQFLIKSDEVELAIRIIKSFLPPGSIPKKYSKARSKSKLPSSARDLLVEQKAHLELTETKKTLEQPPKQQEEKKASPPIDREAYLEPLSDSSGTRETKKKAAEVTEKIDLKAQKKQERVGGKGNIQGQKEAASLQITQPEKEMERVVPELNGKPKKTFDQIFENASNIEFIEAVKLLEKLGATVQRINGSHFFISAENHLGVFKPMILLDDNLLQKEKTNLCLSRPHKSNHLLSYQVKLLREYILNLGYSSPN